LNFFYLIQRNRRELFLHRENEKEWVQVLRKGITTSLILVKYNRKENFIALDLINDNAKKEF